VTWRFLDEAGHDVTADDRSFASAVLARGQEFQHRFDRPGYYSYVCTLHPGMAATVVVR
jgi:plastocyanin